MAALLLTYRHAIAQRMDDWQLLPRNENLTELFFDDYQKLPTRIDPKKTYDIAFTIRNHEHAQTTYHYRIVTSAGDADTHQTLQEESLTLSADEARSITAHTAIPALGERTKVRVLLDFKGVAFGKTTAEQQTQSIHFWAVGRKS